MKSNLNNKSLNRIGSRLSERAKAVVSKVKKTAMQTKTPTTTDAITQRIAEKAYELFQRRGGQSGSEWSDWTLAEEIVRLESSPKKKGAAQKAISQEEIKRLTDQKAYDIFQRNGYQNGGDTFNWLVAEELVRLEKSLSN